jgi:hypothetical protein
MSSPTISFEFTTERSANPRRNPSPRQRHRHPAGGEGEAVQLQDAAYGTLLREPRRALHARIISCKPSTETISTEDDGEGIHGNSFLQCSCSLEHLLQPGTGTQKHLRKMVYQDIGWQRTFGHGRKIVPELLQRSVQRNQRAWSWAKCSTE